MGNKQNKAKNDQGQTIQEKKIDALQNIDCHHNWEQEIYQLEKVIMDSPDGRFVKTILKVEFTYNMEIKYSSSDGSIYRIDQVKDPSEKQEIIMNLEQIKYLQWQGKYNKNKKKVGNWIAYWKGGQLQVGGFYMQHGQKGGKWIELFNNFWDKAQVFENGEYIYGKKIGLWKYTFQNQEIGCGFYDNQSRKIGKWIELKDKFQRNKQIFYKGQYRNGNKYGIWDTYQKIQGNLQIIEVGLYDEVGEKVGQWIETYDNIEDSNRLTYKGQYFKGKKINRWQIYHHSQLIGGGLYNDIGQKIGIWVEPTENYSFGYIVYKGEFIGGRKVDKWSIQLMKSRNGQFKEIGGGSYDCDGVKIGNWIELIYIQQLQSVELLKQLHSDSYIIYIGDYINGKKVGLWDILLMDVENRQSEIIGGGFYTQNNLKIGQWIELSPNYYKNSEIMYQGEYVNGNKLGRWDIYYRQSKQIILGKRYIKITTIHKMINRAGGCYDENNLKCGQWIEISDNFYQESQITYHGNYKSGQKVGQWDIVYNMNYGQYKIEIIGGGQYDFYSESDRKIGDWIELNNGFYWDNQVIYRGSYIDGKKFGKWDTMKRSFIKMKEGFKWCGVQYFNS